MRYNVVRLYRDSRTAQVTYSGLDRDRALELCESRPGQYEDVLEEQQRYVVTGPLKTGDGGSYFTVDDTFTGQEACRVLVKYVGGEPVAKAQAQYAAAALNLQERTENP